MRHAWIVGATALAPVLAGCTDDPAPSDDAQRAGAHPDASAHASGEDARPPSASMLLARYAREAPRPDPSWPGVGRWTDRRASLQSREAALLAQLGGDGDANVQAALGRLYTEVGEYGRGLYCLAQALATLPDDAETWVQLGNNRLGSGFPAEALTLYARALELNRDTTSAWAKSAAAHLELGDDAAARACFEATLERSSRHVDARLGLARLLEDAGELDAAREHLERVVQIDPDHPTALFRLARVLGALGRTSEAELAMQRHERAAILDDLRLREADASASEKAAALGLHYLADGRIADAVRELQSALERARDDAQRVAALAGLVRCARSADQDAANGANGIQNLDELLAELARLAPDHALLAE